MALVLCYVSTHCCWIQNSKFKYNSAKPEIHHFGPVYSPLPWGKKTGTKARGPVGDTSDIQGGDRATRRAIDSFQNTRVCARSRLGRSTLVFFSSARTRPGISLRLPAGSAWSGLKLELVSAAEHCPSTATVLPHASGWVRGPIKAQPPNTWPISSLPFPSLRPQGTSEVSHSH